MVRYGVAGTGGSGSGSDAIDPLPEGCVEDAWKAIMIYVRTHYLNLRSSSYYYYHTTLILYAALGTLARVLTVAFQ